MDGVSIVGLLFLFFSWYFTKEVKEIEKTLIEQKDNTFYHFVNDCKPLLDRHLVYNKVMKYSSYSIVIITMLMQVLGFFGVIKYG